MTKLMFALSALFVLSGCINTNAKTADSEAMRIGTLVQQVDGAIANPSAESLEIIALAGTDSRHYVMIRGWLVQTLAGVRSQYDATRNADKKAQLKTKLDFLQQAIRRIDLE